MITAERNTEVRIAVAVVLLGLTASLALGLCSEGMHHVDDLAHFLMAKWSWTYPAWLVDDWGRPGFTTLYAIPAAIGWPAARAWSAAISALTAWMAFRLAQRSGVKSAWLVPALTYAQPLFFELTLTTLTETALAFYLTAALLLAARSQWTCSAAVISVAFVTRYESIAFLPVWAFFAWQQRVPWWRLWPLPWAVVAFSTAALIAGMPVAAVRWLSPQPTTWYGSGGWLTMLARTVQACGPALAAMGLAGSIALMRAAWPGRMAATIVVVHLGVQTAIRALGAFDSGGYARFLVPIAPCVAIAATACWHHLGDAESGRRRRAVAWLAVAIAILWLSVEVQVRRPETPRDLPQVAQAATAVRAACGALLLICVVAAAPLHRRRSPRSAFISGTSLLRAALIGLTSATMAVLARPLALGPAERAIAQEMDWLRSAGLGDRPIVSAHAYVEYLTGLAQPPNRPGLNGRLHHAPIGAILAWDSQFAPAPHQDLPLADAEASLSLRFLRGAEAERGFRLRLYEKVGDWPLPSGRAR